MDRRERRRIRRMQEERQKEQKQEERGNTLKVGLGLAATAGVAYAGYRYRGNISNTVKNVTTRAAEEVGSRTGNRAFQERVQETKNVMEAISDTYNQEQQGAAGTFSKLFENLAPGKREEAIRRRVSQLNEATQENARQNAVPRDIRQSFKEMTGTSAGTYNASALKNLERVIDQQDDDSPLNRRQKELVEIARESTKSRDSNLFRYTSPVDSDDTVDQKIIEQLYNYNRNDDKTIDLDFDDDSDLIETAKAFSDVIEESKRQTSRQAQSYQAYMKKRPNHRQPSDLEGNVFAEEKLLERAARFEGVRQRGEDAGPVADNLLERGYRRATMGDARHRVVERDGQWFLDRDSKEGQTLDRLFSPEYEGKGGLAERFTQTARELGLRSDDSRVTSTVFSNQLFIHDETGQVLNMGAVENMVEESLNFAQDNFQVPVINFNPLNFLQRTYTRQQQNTPKSAFYRRGSVSAFTGDDLDVVEDLNVRNRKSTGVLARDYFQVGDTIYDGDVASELLDSNAESVYDAFQSALEGHKVADGYTVLNTRQGAGREFADTLSKRRLSEDDRGAFKRLFDIDDDQDTMWSDIRQSLESFEDASFGQNQPVAVASDIGVGNYDQAVEGIADIGQKVDRTTTPLSEEARTYFSDYLADAIARDTANPKFDGLDFETRDGLLDMAEWITRRDSKQIPSDDVTQRTIQDLRREIRRNFDFAQEDPEEFFGQTKYVFSNNIIDSDYANLTGADRPIELTGEEQLRGLIESYGALAGQQQGRDLDAYLQGKDFTRPSQSIIDELDELVTRTESRFFGERVRAAATPQERVDLSHQWIDHFKQGDKFYHLHSVMGDIEPFGKKAVDTAFESVTGATQMPIKQHRGLLRGINEAYTDMADGKGQGLDPLFDVLGEQVNRVTGHRQPTTGSVLPWHLTNKLNKSVERFGLGISPEHRQSAVGTIGNISLYRLLMPVMAYQTARSLDDFFFDGGVRKQAAQGYANLHIGVAGVRDQFGLTDLSETLETYIPGMEHLRGSPVGMAASTLSFGLVGDGRSQEELEEYYRSGEDPIRKGRWWDIGSTTPWIGGRIEYYRPNLYRRIMSDYQYTDTMYGSKREYWTNHWMPNIYNPLAPIRHFITDPYHYEEKHQDTRPYAYTGGYASLQAIPVIGPAVDGVVSSVFKPSREHPELKKSHRAFLRAENERLTSAYLGVNSPGLIDITPKGKVNLTTTAPEVNIIDEETGLYDEESAIADDIRFESERQSIGRGVGRQAQREGKTIQVTVEDYAKNQLAQYNTALAGVPQGGRTFTPASIHSQINPYTVHSTQDVVQATGLNDIRSMGIHAADQLQDMGGMFGFISANMMGTTTSDDRIRFEDSSRFGSWRESFWDMNLGGFDGLGGDLSEIMRRFIGGNTNYNYYNPIRNEVSKQHPWLPSSEYFIDFHHGDAYKKVPYGEIRLPSAAYEEIYNVKKDQFGNYSAFDRYRILADVAPYSDQYRLAKSEVALLNQNGLLDEGQQEEYRQIREQVSNKSKKHRFYPREFTNAGVNRETVTVTKVIDQNTFLTEEYGSNPIKLAGVGIKADDEENVELMRQIVQPGQKVEIGLDRDPMNRVRDDMMDTMRAVVYAPRRVGFDPRIPLSGGQNVNQFLSQQSEEDGGSISIKDDGTAVATAALYSEGQITVGRTMEWLAHDLLPNIPFVGILADKFYPVRSPVEEYERLTYSKSFRSWNRPIQDWVIPMLDTATNHNPLVSSIRGAGIASMFSKNQRKRPLYAHIGGSIYGTLSGIRSLYELGDRMFGDGERWIPERRQEQREVDEYFDKIQYIKYKGLYEQAKAMAEQEEGIDLDAYLRLTEEEGQDNANYQSYLEEQKKWINIAGKSSSSETVSDYAREQVRRINDQLKAIDERRPNQMVGSYTALALRYKEEYESTLYGARDTYDYMKIYRSLPKRDKEFFTAFQKASPEERQEILRLVPKNQRNIYRRQWGLEEDPDDDVTLNEYFSEYALPDPEWEGWRPEVSLDNIQIKVMQNEGMDLTEANYWDEHVDRAEMDPVQPIDIQPLPETPVSQLINQTRLKKALEGAGLDDVRIGLKTSATDVSYFNTQLTINRNREDEIQNGIQTYLNH